MPGRRTPSQANGDVLFIAILMMVAFRFSKDRQKRKWRPSCVAFIFPLGLSVYITLYGAAMDRQLKSSGRIKENSVAHVSKQRVREKGVENMPVRLSSGTLLLCWHSVNSPDGQLAMSSGQVEAYQPAISHIPSLLPFILHPPPSSFYSSDRPLLCASLRGPRPFRGGP